MARTRPALLALLLVVLLAAGAWLVVTFVNGVRLGVRDADPALYWPATVIIGLLAVACLAGARRAFLALRSARRDVRRARV